MKLFYNSLFKALCSILCLTFLFFYVSYTTYGNETKTYKKLTYDAVTDLSATTYSATLSDREVDSYRVAPFIQDMYVKHTLSSNTKFGIMPISTFDIYYNSLIPAKLGQVLIFNKEDINPRTLDIEPKNIKYGKDYTYITVQEQNTPTHYAKNSQELLIYTSLVNNLHLTVVPSELSTEQNRVCGVFSDFIFSLPTDTNFIAKSTKNHYNNYVDKITFYYIPENEKHEEEIMELIVSEKAILDKNLKQIYSNDLIYYVKITEENNYKNKEDKENFKKTTARLKRNNYYVLRKAITERTTKKTSRVLSSAPIYLNGKNTNVFYNVHEDGTKTFPIVDLLESMGYKSNSKYIDEMIYLQKDEFCISVQSGYSNIYTDYGNIKLKYPLFIYQDTLYCDLSTMKKLFGHGYKINSKGELILTTK